MIARWLFRFTATRPCRLVSRGGTPYMERYFLLKVFGLTVYLHRFVDGDGDEEVHNHPWRSLAVCLAGGYREERLTGLCVMTGWRSRFRRIWPLRPNWIGLKDFHRVTEAEPETWTLFVHGSLQQGWGFLRKVPDSWIGRRYRVEFYQRFPLTNGNCWWKTALRGKDIGREPFEGPR